MNCYLFYCIIHYYVMVNMYLYYCVSSVSYYVLFLFMHYYLLCLLLVIRCYILFFIVGY